MTAQAGALDRIRSRAFLPTISAVDVVVVLAQAIVFLPFAALRYIDGDEGDYVLASQLALDGKVPYADFLHTQMPLLPYAYGLWTSVWGESWYAARALSVVFAVLLGTLLFRHLAARHGDVLAAAGLALYVSSSLVFGWFTTVKTQVLSTLLLFAAYVLVTRERGARWLAAGVLIGLAIDTRLIFAGALPAFAWVAWRAGAARRLAGGLALGLLPALVLFALDPRRFWFDNLGYHAARTDDGLVGDFRQKADIVRDLFGAGGDGSSTFQFLLLTAAAVAGALLSRSRGGRVPFALVVAAWLGLASLLPTPAYRQYFATVVPFLIVGAIELVAQLRDGRAYGRRAAAVLVAAVAGYALLAATDASRFVRTFADQRIGVVGDVRDLVQAETRPGEEVLASWPGYLFGTHAAPVPGLENAYAAHEAARLTAAEAHDYRIVTDRQIERMIEERRTRIVVVRLWHELPPIPNYSRALRRAGYAHVARLGSTDVYRAPAS